MKEIVEEIEKRIGKWVTNTALWLAIA
jgi:hypothetical protein